MSRPKGRRGASPASSCAARSAVEYEGETYGLRVHECRRSRSCPTGGGGASSCARIDEADARDVRFCAPTAGSSSTPAPAAERGPTATTSGSKAELMVAKNMYVRARSGCSRRSIATGERAPRPAQETGYSDPPYGGGVLVLDLRRRRRAEEIAGTMIATPATPVRSGAALRPVVLGGCGALQLHDFRGRRQRIWSNGVSTQPGTSVRRLNWGCGNWTPGWTTPTSPRAPASTSPATSSRLTLEDDSREVVASRAAGDRLRRLLHVARAAPGCGRAACCGSRCGPRQGDRCLPPGNAEMFVIATSSGKTSREDDHTDGVVRRSRTLVTHGFTRSCCEGWASRRSRVRVQRTNSPYPRSSSSTTASTRALRRSVK